MSRTSGGHRVQFINVLVVPNMLWLFVVADMLMKSMHHVALKVRGKSASTRRVVSWVER